jgi:ribosome maturation factor RimP
MSGIVEKIEIFLNSKIQNSDIEITDLEYIKENGSWILRIFIDKENGITIDDCEKMGYEFSKYLDESEILDNSYVLEVSSPGLNRTLKKEKDFKRFVNSNIRLHSIVPIDGQRNFLGELLSFDNDLIKINDVTNGIKEIQFSNIKKANIESGL